MKSESTAYIKRPLLIIERVLHTNVLKLAFLKTPAVYYRLFLFS